MKILFVAWDGPHQNYLESLFFPIFDRLGARGCEVHTAQFRFGGQDGVASARLAAEERGLPFLHLPIVRRPKVSGAAFSLARGIASLARYSAKHGIDVLMPRSTLPGAMTLALRRLGHRRIVFDADGLAPDERVDFAGWRPTGLMYRAWRESDAQLVRVADSVITRTERAKQILIARAGAGTSEEKIHVIPNGKDEAVYRPTEDDELRQLRSRMGFAPAAPLVIYAGSLGPHYYPDEMFRFFGYVRDRRPDAHFVLLTGQPDTARAIAARMGVMSEALTVRRVPAEQVPGYMAAADLGLALREPSFSQRAVSPIKVGEYLLSGLPVLATKGVGDLDTQLASASPIGRLLGDCGDDALRDAASWFVDDVLPDRAAFRRNARERGVEVFGLDRCVERYADALAWATSPNRTSAASRTSVRSVRTEPNPESEMETTKCPRP